MKTLAALLSLALITTPAIGETRISTVDINRVLNQNADAQARKKAIDDRAIAVRTTIDAKKAALEDLQKKLQAQKISDASPEAEDFRAKARELERFVRDNDEELKKDFLKLNKEVTGKVLKLVGEYAKSHKIDLVLDKGEQARSPLLYSEASSDITDAIIKQLH